MDLLTPVKRRRTGDGDKFLLSDLDSSTLQLLLDLEDDSSADEEMLEQTEIIDISGFDEPDNLMPLSPTALPYYDILDVVTPGSPHAQEPTPMIAPPLLPPPSLPPPSSTLVHSSSPSPPLSQPTSPAPTYSWSHDPPPTRPSFPYTGDSNLRTPPIGFEPHNFFDLFFTEDFFDLLVRETNNFADELLCRKVLEQIERAEKGLPKQKYLAIFAWQDTTKKEMKKWLGLYIMMGVLKLDRYKDYWCQNEKFDLKFFAGHMSRNRWCNILEALHFADNDNCTDPLYKVRPLLSLFHERITALINPGKNLCLDESLAPWRGKLSFRQYIPLKSHKYGLKLYMLTEPDGLIHRFIVYVGAHDREVGGEGHASKVVNKLMTGLTGEGRSLFMDNYYNSVELATCLLKDSTYVTGTLRPNRKHNPEDLITLKLKKGESAQRWTQGGIYIVKWKDKRDVLVISTEVSGDMVFYETRRGTASSKPLSVQLYNKNMGGIDLVDQHLAYYSSPHKSVKWYKKFGLHVLELMLLDAYFLYRRFSVVSRKVELYQFRLTIVDYLCGPLPTPTPSTSLHKTNDIIFMRHFPHMHHYDQNGRRKQLRCRICYAQKVRKMTPVFCPGCPDQPGLCLDNCFIKYHRSLGVKIVV